MFALNPSQNFEHLLHAVSGSDGMHDLQYVATPSAAADFRRGALVSLLANGEMEQDLTIAVAMPMFAISDSTDYDAASDTGNTAGGNTSAFVATGGYELKTTEVDLDNFVAADYAPNRALISAVLADVTQVGKLSPITAGTFPALSNIVGTISRGIDTDVYDQQVLYFWPEHLPART